LCELSLILHLSVGLSCADLAELPYFVVFWPNSSPAKNWHEFCLSRRENPRDTEERFPMDEILTASEVAELLQIHPRTVYKLVKEGSLPGRKFGGGWRFSRSEILAMVSPQGSPPQPGKLHTEER
jgi:excisionase family DNA binding protein